MMNLLNVLHQIDTHMGFLVENLNMLEGTNSWITP